MAEGQVTFLFQQRGAQTVRQQVEAVAATLRGTATATRDTAAAGDMLVGRFRALQQQAQLGRITQTQYAQQLRTTIADLRGFAATTRLGGDAERFFAEQTRLMTVELTRAQTAGVAANRAFNRIGFGIQSLAAGFAHGRVSAEALGAALLTLAPTSTIAAAAAAGLSLLAVGMVAFKRGTDDATKSWIDLTREMSVGRLRGNVATLAAQNVYLQRIAAAVPEQQLGGVFRTDPQLRNILDARLTTFERMSSLPEVQLARALERTGVMESAARAALPAAQRALEQHLDALGRRAARDAARDTRGIFAGGQQFIDERLAAQRTRDEGLAMLMTQAREARESGFAGDVARERRRGQMPALDPLLRDLIGGQAESVKAITAALEDQERAWARTAEQARVFGSAAGEAVGGLIDAAASGKNVLEAFFAAGLKALAQEARAKAIFETAEGFASLFSITKGGGVGAAAHFRAAALYGAAAVALGAAASSAGGGGGGGAGAFRSGASAEGGAGRGEIIVEVPGDSLFFGGRGNPALLDWFVGLLEQVGQRRVVVRGV